MAKKFYRGISIDHIVEVTDNKGQERAKYPTRIYVTGDREWQFSGTPESNIAAIEAIISDNGQAEARLRGVQWEHDYYLRKIEEAKADLAAIEQIIEGRTDPSVVKRCAVALKKWLLSNRNYIKAVEKEPIVAFVDSFAQEQTP